MVLDHERLDVCLVALDFLVFAKEAIARLPRERGHLADQFTRASTSIVLNLVVLNLVVLNLAEGAGKLSKADKLPPTTEWRGSREPRLFALVTCPCPCPCPCPISLSESRTIGDAPKA